MKIGLAVLGTLLALGLAVGVWFIKTNNGLVGKQEAVNAAWAQVQNVYQRRSDLIPNLVATVQGAAKFEKSTLTAVVEARAKVGSFTVDKSILDNPEQFKKFESAQGDLGRSLSRLMVVIEKYPDLQATANFRDLQVQLEGTENRISTERHAFNEIVQDYNTSIRVMPANLVAGFRGFQAKAYFAADTGAEAAPKVKFE